MGPMSLAQEVIATIIMLLLINILEECPVDLISSSPGTCKCNRGKTTLIDHLLHPMSRLIIVTIKVSSILLCTNKDHLLKVQRLDRQQILLYIPHLGHTVNAMKQLRRLAM